MALESRLTPNAAPLGAAGIVAPLYGTEGHPGEPAQIQLALWDGDWDDLTVSVVTPPARGTLTTAGPQTVQPVAVGSFLIYEDLFFDYVPDVGNYGLDPDTVTFEITDGTDTVQVTANINFRNTAPYPTGGYGPTVYTDEDVSTTVDLVALAGDPDGDTLSASGVTVGQGYYGGTVTLSGGVATYTPAPNYTGSDVFEYTVTDQYGGTYTDTITVSMNPVNDAPVASARSYEMVAGGARTIDASAGLVTGSDDADGDTVTATLVQGPGSGTVVVNSDGSFTYTPDDPYFVGTVTFEYSLSDGVRISQTATVTLNVNLLYTFGGGEWVELDGSGDDIGWLVVGSDGGLWFATGSAANPYFASLGGWDFSATEQQVFMSGEPAQPPPTGSDPLYRLRLLLDPPLGRAGPPAEPAPPPRVHLELPPAGQPPAPSSWSITQNADGSIDINYGHNGNRMHISPSGEVQITTPGGIVITIKGKPKP